MRRAAALLCVAACESAAPPAPKPPVPALRAPRDAALDAVAPPDAPAAYPELAAQPDPPGARVRRPTAVLLIAARGGVEIDPADLRAERRYVPLVCAIRGRLAVGEACGAVMPARATIRTPEGPLVVSRPTTVFHDEAGGEDYAPPRAPACCTYNACRASTIPYAGTAKPAAQASRFGVWPADADIDLRVSPTAPVQPDIHGLGARANVLLATTDLDGDGVRERTIYEVWANDFGIQVAPEHDATPLYQFSCGNI